MKKTKKWVKLEVGEELLKYLGKKYDLPISMVVSQQALKHVMKQRLFVSSHGEDNTIV